MKGPRHDESFAELGESWQNFIITDQFLTAQYDQGLRPIHGTGNPNAFNSYNVHGQVSLVSSKKARDGEELHRHKLLS
jgi:hypothetical protein